MLLYKVTAPRKSKLFNPTRFYRTPDFRSSSTNPKPGYITDCLLYVGDFEEISIHLFPKIHRIRVKNTKASRLKLASLGFETDPSKKCYIFAHRKDQGQIMEFEATVYAFEDNHFMKTPSNEYISRHPVEAISSESYTMSEILQRWCIQLILVASVPKLSDIFSDSSIIYSYQT